MTTRSLIHASLAILLLAGTGLLAACSKRPVLQQCPRVGILGDAQKATQYRAGAGRDLTDVAFDVELLDYNGDCRYENNETTVIVRFVLQVGASRGPAAAAPVAEVPYFVAVVDKQQNILARERFVARVPFKEGQRRVVIGDELEQAIPLAGRRTSEIEILVGLEVPRDQLERSRQQRGF